MRCQLCLTAMVVLSACGPRSDSGGLTLSTEAEGSELAVSDYQGESPVVVRSEPLAPSTLGHDGERLFRDTWDRDTGEVEDPGEEQIWYLDADGDGYGDASDTLRSVRQPTGYTADGTDCDDSDASIHPFAGDFLGDQEDSDCDGLDCEAGGYGDAYFVVCTEDEHNVNWSVADWLCTDAGHDGLASIRDAGEQAWVEGLLQDAGGWEHDAPWVGLSDADTEGEWVWSDGWQGEYTDWTPGEPNSDGDEDCAHLNWRLSWGTWNDADCSFERSWGGFVCQTR